MIGRETDLVNVLASLIICRGTAELRLTGLWIYETVELRQFGLYITIHLEHAAQPPKRNRIAVLSCLPPTQRGGVRLFSKSKSTWPSNVNHISKHIAGEGWRLPSPPRPAEYWTTHTRALGTYSERIVGIRKPLGSWRTVSPPWHCSCGLRTCP